MVPSSDPDHTNQFFKEVHEGQDFLNGNVGDQNEPQRRIEQEPQPAPQLLPHSQQPGENSWQEQEDPGKAVSSFPIYTNTTTDSSDEQACSEKKRKREIQCRSDLNQKYSELTELLHRIHEEDNNELSIDTKEKEKKLLLSSFKSNQDGLIAQATSLVAQLHKSNKRTKNEIKNVEQKLKEVRRTERETAARLKEFLALPATPGGGMPFSPMTSKFEFSDAFPLYTTVPTAYSYPTYTSHLSAPIGNTAYSHSAQDTVHTSSESLTQTRSTAAEQFPGSLNMSFTPIPTTAPAFPSFGAHNETARALHATAPVPTHVVQTATSSVPSPPTPMTASSDDGKNLVPFALSHK